LLYEADRVGKDRELTGKNYSKNMASEQRLLFLKLHLNILGKRAKVKYG
jgi:hypothetical protein